MRSNPHDGEMQPYTIRIDPALPVCWENTDTLRIGFDQAEVLVTRPTAGVQRFIGMLRQGVPSTQLNSATRKAGISVSTRQKLMLQLSHVLVHEAILSPIARPMPQPQSTARTCEVLGEGPFASRLRSALAIAGFSPAQDSAPEFAIVVEYFREPAARAQHLLISGVPHLPIRLSDRSMTLGPLVLPGGAPCLSCLELHGSRDEPLASLLAAQLLGEVPASATERCAERASALIIALHEHWLAGVPELTQCRLRYPVRNGIVGIIPTTEAVSGHRECACISLANAA